MVHKLSSLQVIELYFSSLRLISTRFLTPMQLLHLISNPTLSTNHFFSLILLVQVHQFHIQKGKHAYVPNQ